MRNTIFQTFLATSHSPLVTAFEPPVTPLLRVALLAVFLTLSPLITSHSSLRLEAQSTNASVTGYITDPSKAAIAGAKVIAINVDTNARYEGISNGVGSYDIPSLPPGPYRLEVEKTGFKTVVKSDLILHVQDTAAINVDMALGSQSEIVTVEGGAPMINATDASVSTVVDRKFVENMPLNGRSFQSLILLAPGVLTNTPQAVARTGTSGEFSINGQRTDANYYSIDGVSANNVAPNTFGSTAGSSGSLAATTALGSTQALVSVDALQEFRISTSTYSAEYGRSPGGQIQFETRPGTNSFHGTAFDYLRNSVFDANNWFNNASRLAKPAERQNDFGGALGGPLGLPGLYSGKDRIFFFFSYEGLRLNQPQPATIAYVPTLAFRQAAPAALQPLLNAFPLPNCAAAQDSQCVNDSAEGLSPYILSTALPSSIDAVSVRGDYAAAPWLRLFFRYSDTESSAVGSITGANEVSTQYSTRTYTLGADAAFRGNVSNQFRLGYSPTQGVVTDQFTSLGGGTPVDLQELQGLPSGRGETIFYLVFKNESAVLSPERLGTPQHQWNVIDTLNWSRGRHNLRGGVDYRRSTSYFNAGSLAASPETVYEYLDETSTLSNQTYLAESAISARQDAAFTNFSAFIQDEWKVNSRLALSLGLRWELNPPPIVVSGAQQYTVNGNFNNPPSISLAPAGTPLYNTTYFNFAPRLGVATTLHGRPGHETVLRAGGGVYYDTGQQLFNLFGAGNSPGTGSRRVYRPASFPLPVNLINVPISVTPPYGTMYVASRQLQLPYTYQWNAALEQALSPKQSVIISYVGSNGRRLLAVQELIPGSLNPNFPSIVSFVNGLSSSYNALQTQYRRSLSRGLQALASYTWSHGIDFESRDSGLLPYQRGNSDNDVRNNLSTAVSYDVPSRYAEAWKRVFLAQWGGDLRFTARTAFPVQVQGAFFTDPNTGSTNYGLLNYNSNVPLYLDQVGMPGGRVVNAAAFSVPLAGQQGNAPRNFVRGFGENEINLAIRREFPVNEQVHLLFRAEAFNVLNHPNFGAVNVTCGNPAAGQTCTNPTFGQATATLAADLCMNLSQE